MILAATVDMKDMFAWTGVIFAAFACQAGSVYKNNL